MYKLPADTSGKIIPVTTKDPKTNAITPVTFQDSMDETGTHNNNTFLTGLNAALAECINKGDTCYAVVIKNPIDPSVPASSTGNAYVFELAQKPLRNSTNDSESLSCNTLYSTYIKNKKLNGVSNLMPNSIPCDFTQPPITYTGSSGNSSKSSDNKPPPPTKFSYKDAGISVKKTPLPWLLIISIVCVIIVIGGGIYWYYKMGPGSVSSESSASSASSMPKVSTSKLIKKSGGYFFFV